MSADFFITYVLCFAVYGFIGWVVESSYCSILFHRPVNRGFLNGPVIPVYAVGALVMVLFVSLLPRFTQPAQAAVVYISGVVLTSAVEYFTGWLLETLFKSKWWDYSDMKFNLKGRICLENSLCFGFMALVIVYAVHPALINMFSAWPRDLKFWFSLVFIAVFTIDLALSVAAVIGLNRRLHDIQQGLAKIRDKLDEFQFDMTLGVRERIARFYDTHDPENQLYKTIELMDAGIRRIERDNRLIQRRLLRAFPNFRSLKYPSDLLDSIKSQIGLIINRRKETSPSPAAGGNDNAESRPQRTEDK